MDDIASKLGALLQDPGGLEQLKQLASALMDGGSSDDNTPPTTSVPTPAMTVTSPEPSGGISDVAALMRVASALKTMHKETDHTRLLLALKPYLSDGRKQKIDSALRILRLLELLPMIQDSGIL